MKKKRSNKNLDLSKIGKAIVDVAVSAKDVVKIAVFGRTKKKATARKAPTKAKGAPAGKVKAKTTSTAKKATPPKKAGTAAKKKPVKKATR
jgi:hypothetical protein